jgi:uncharacterized repeat protein (TIGR02543 family)
MRKEAWFFKNRTGLGILGVVLVFGMMAAGCSMGDEDPPVAPTTYVVSFSTDGGSDVPDQTVEEGKTVTKPDNPTKTGNTFANWYRDAGKTVLWNFATDVVVMDTTIYAKWVSGENLPRYPVTFDVDGGSPAPVAQDVLKNEPVPEPPKPSKTGYIFNGWYNGEYKWNFATNTVTGTITLKARWVQAVTVTFNTNGGSAINPIAVAVGSGVDPSKYRPSKDGYVFDGWYTNAELTISAGNYQPTVSTDITLYAKWTSTSELAPYAGVWQSSKDWGNRNYWLQADGTAWGFSVSTSYFEFGKTRWSTSQIDGTEGTFNETQFTPSYGGGFVYTKTTETKTPAAATAASNILGTWLRGSRSIELEADGNAVLNAYGDSITLKYRAEENAVYLLTPTGDLVIASITVSGGKLAGLSKPTNDNALTGIWKLTKGSQDYYWDMKADGSGTFHTLGASVPFSFTVTENKEIDGYDYGVSGNTLVLAIWDMESSSDLALSKVDSVPSGAGADGDSRLHGTWKAMEGGETITITLNSNGVLVQSMGGEDRSGIWKADGNNLLFYIPDFGSFRQGVPYSVSGSTLTFYEMDWTKQ